MFEFCSGTKDLSWIIIPQDYWGFPQLPDWEDLGPEACEGSIMDPISTRALPVCRQGGLSDQQWTWPVLTSGRAEAGMYCLESLSQRSLPPKAALPLPAEHRFPHAEHRLAMAQRQQSRPRNPPPGGRILTHDLVRSVSSSSVHLDLGLERLLSLKGLDELSPGVEASSKIHERIHKKSY